MEDEGDYDYDYDDADDGDVMIMFDGGVVSFGRFETVCPAFSPHVCAQT